MSNRAAFRGNIRSRFSIPNPHQVFPLAIVALEAKAPAATACDTTWQYEAARNSSCDRLRFMDYDAL